VAGFWERLNARVTRFGIPGRTTPWSLAPGVLLSRDATSTMRAWQGGILEDLRNGRGLRGFSRVARVGLRIEMIRRLHRTLTMRCPIKVYEHLQNEWLGGRDSNPDTQIQSLLPSGPALRENLRQQSDFPNASGLLRLRSAGASKARFRKQNSSNDRQTRNPVKPGWYPA